MASIFLLQSFCVRLRAFACVGVFAKFQQKESFGTRTGGGDSSFPHEIIWCLLVRLVGCEAADGGGSRRGAAGGERQGRRKNLHHPGTVRIILPGTRRSRALAETIVRQMARNLCLNTKQQEKSFPQNANSSLFLCVCAK